MTAPKLRLLLTGLAIMVGLSLNAQYFDDTSVISKDPDDSRYIDDLFSAYPNPNAGQLFSLELQHSYRGDLAIEVYDVYGRKYYARIIEKTDDILYYNIEADYWASGVYIIAITGDGVRSSRRVIKE